MQMINKNSGVTLIILVMTIVTLIIILSITINYGLSAIHDVTNKRTESELGVVQEAIIQRYASVQALNELGKTAVKITANADSTAASEANRPKGFVGTRMANSNDVLNYGFTGVTLKVQYSSTDASTLPYEKYYYLLNEDDLSSLGINKGDDARVSDEVASKERSYIVNYFTGEVFDIANKKYYKTESTNDDPIYTQPTDVTVDEKNYDYSD